MALPRREWGQIFRPYDPPEPNKVQAQTTNPYATLGQSVLSGIGDLASDGAFDNMFTPGPSGYTPGAAGNSLGFDLTGNPLNLPSMVPNSFGFNTSLTP